MNAEYLNVAVCQPTPAWNRDLGRIGREVAAAKGHLVLLPEMFATGFRVDAARVAQPMDGEIVSAMRRWAADSGKAVAGSVAVAEDGKFYNRMIFAEPSGRMTYYDKRHLFSPGGEADAFTPGARRTVVEFGGMRFLLQVCYDLRFPVWSRCRNDYDAILYCAAWPESRRDVWRTLLRARAIENQCYVVGANCLGEDSFGRYVGDSAVIGFRGETLAEAGAGESLLSACLDPESLAAFRTKFPVWRDADDFCLRDK